MRYEEFVKAVQGYSGIHDRYEVEMIIKATLQTLTERLTIEEAKHISSQLPFELKNYMNFNPSEDFSVEEFYRRVAERESSDEKTAKIHSKAVLTVLDEAISSGEISHIKAQLPEEFLQIFP